MVGEFFKSNVPDELDAKGYAEAKDVLAGFLKEYAPHLDIEESPVEELASFLKAYEGNTADDLVTAADWEFGGFIESDPDDEDVREEAAAEFNDDPDYVWHDDSHGIFYYIKKGFTDFGDTEPRALHESRRRRRLGEAVDRAEVIDNLESCLANAKRSATDLEKALERVKNGGNPLAEGIPMLYGSLDLATSMTKKHLRRLGWM